MIALEAGTAVAAAAAAVAAWRSAGSARDAVAEARRAIQADLVSTARKSYADQAMLQAIDLVRTWKGEEILLDSKMDRARRLVSHHFQHIALLLRANLIDDSLARLAAQKDEVALFCKFIEPMEQKINPGYDRSPFNELAALYGGRQHLPIQPPRS